MSVITAPMIELAPTQNFAELLRSIPGLNITQVSARDINVTSRAPTGTLATGQLALLDGRSLYQDFFGFVMWDFLPVNLNEIKQIEVIRGPASAVWGANALYGVVNVISKSPREMQGTSVTTGLGGVRSLGQRQRRRRRDRWCTSAARTRRRSTIAGRSSCRAAATRRIRCRGRPGTIPGAPGGTQYPSFTNNGTTQPKFDARLDYDFEDGSELSFSGGFAGTEGIMHSGIGPFDIDTGSTMGYGRVSYCDAGCGRLRSPTCSTATATNLLTRDIRRQARSISTSRRRRSTSTSPTSRRSAGATSSATAATCASTTSICRWRRRPTTAPSSASTRRTRSSCPTTSAGSSARASIGSTTSTTSCSRRARRS